MKYSLVLMALLGVSARHHHHHRQYYPHSFAQEEKEPWNPTKSRETFEAHRDEAAQVVATQEAFEARKTADVAARNEANIAAANKLKNHVKLARTRQMAGDYPQRPYPTVQQWAARPQFLAQEEPAAEEANPGPKPGTPAFSYKEKADSLKEVRRTVAEQKRFMAEHNQMVADNFAADDAAAKAERARVSRARQTQLQGGLDY